MLQLRVSEEVFKMHISNADEIYSGLAFPTLFVAP